MLTNYPDAPDIESSTQDYAQRFKGQVGRWFLSTQQKATAKAIKKQFGDRKGLSVADIGGGHGQNINLIKNLGHELTVAGSFNSSTVLIQDAIDNKEIKYVEVSLRELPFPDNSFDVVICYRVYSHMDSWETLSDELMRVAKTLVLIDYPHKYSVNYFSDALFKIKKKIENNTRRYQMFTDSQISLQFASSNWKKVFSFRQFLLPMALHRLINIKPVSVCLEGVSRILGITLLFGSPVIAGFICPEVIDIILSTDATSLKNKESH